MVPTTLQAFLRAEIAGRGNPDSPLLLEDRERRDDLIPEQTQFITLSLLYIPSVLFRAAIAPVTATCPQPFCCVILHTAGCAISAKSPRAAVLKGNQFILVRDILPFCIRSVFHRHDKIFFLLVVFSRLIGFKDIQPPFSPALGIQVEGTSHRCATRVQITKHEVASSHNQGVPDL